MKSKAFVCTLTCIGLAALCLILTGAGLLIRHLNSGVNPLRELRMATLGEGIELKEFPEPDGRIQHTLLIDAIDHGTQYQGEKKMRGGPLDGTNWPRVPTTYYHTDGPIGMAFSKLNWFPVRDHAWQAADARLPASLIASAAFAPSTGPWDLLATAWSEPPVGVIMMNNGTLAAYARPFQTFDFYERNPAVLKLSVPNQGDIRKFTYIDDAKKRGAHIRVFEGNERTAFDKDAPKNFYHVLVVDTSRGHPGLPSKDLLTKEAWQSYMSALVENGVVCVHVSSRNFDLAEVVASTSNAADLAHLRVHDGNTDRNVGRYSSEWVVVARKRAALKYVEDAAIVHRQMNPGKAGNGGIDVTILPAKADLVWTDAGSNSLSSVKR